ncbi:Type I restriction-modification system methyltransferase subunit [Methanolobus psychrophilus R15]|nr:Type I restriction-modification system methyltransferase subunit [Methanolobus psychrophilus R15]
MSESTSQGIPFLELNESGLRLFKCNDISFTHLRREGFDCLSSRKKPDQIVAHNNQILIGIEDKDNASDMEKAINQIKDNYLSVLPNTNYFIARVGDQVKTFFRIGNDNITEIGTTYKGKEVSCFGKKVISKQNAVAQNHLLLLSEQILLGKKPVNNSLEILPPKEYYNPLIVKEPTIYGLWQKIFVATGENAHTCLATFIELLLYKGISDAKLLPQDYLITELANPAKTNSLDTYKNVIRSYIKVNVFPTIANQPGVINGFAFDKQETVFKNVLSDLCELGNLANRQIDPDFKRRVIEAFLGSAHSEGTIKNGKHLTPRSIIQAIWEMASPSAGKKVIDPACGVGGFVLEGLNYPYEFNPLSYNCFGIDRDEQMIITAKANMILHLLDKFVDPSYDNKKLVEKINSTFLHATHNGTGTLGEMELINKASSEEETASNGNSDNSIELLYPIHSADYVLTNIPYYVNGVKQIDDSLIEANLFSFYKSCGLGVESRFIKYILYQIKNGNPGWAYVIVTDGILYRHKDKIRDVIKEHADVMGIISLPVGCFQNNNWKTSILIFKTKSEMKEYSPVFLYDIENIGLSLDSYRTPIDENDIPNMKIAWEKRLSGTNADSKCKLVSRDEFDKCGRWSELFDWCREKTNDDKISFQEFLEQSHVIIEDLNQIINQGDKELGDIFSLEDYIEVKLDNQDYFTTRQHDNYVTVRHARLNLGSYPLYSSKTDGPIHLMYDETNPPLLIENETNQENNMLISWNIKGDPCEDIRLHETPFYVTENRGLIEIVNDNICLEYVLYYLREHLKNDGKFSRLNEAHVGKVKNFFVRIPTDENGGIDLNKQIEVARSYEKINTLKSKVMSKKNDLDELLLNIDVFK